MKYNCYRTLDFSHEVKRMCKTVKKCSDCPLELNCHCNLTDEISQDEISQKEIYTVQKWSDEHPEETMSEHFMKLFPNAPYYLDKTPRACPRNLGWIEDKPCAGMPCSKCWSKPYKESNKK